MKQALTTMYCCVLVPGCGGSVLTSLAVTYTELSVLDNPCKQFQID